MTTHPGRRPTVQAYDREIRQAAAAIMALDVGDDASELRILKGVLALTKQRIKAIVEDTETDGQ